MNLVIFDIDGTLTRTNQVDNDCFQTAFTHFFGREVQPQDWHGLTHVTDAGILEGLLKNLRGSGPTPAETAAFKRDFFGRLVRARDEEPKAFAPVPGAGELLDLLRTRPDWEVALATGGWLGSALLKLEASGLPFQGTPLATSDDAAPREEILAMALERARRLNAGQGFDRVVSVGDGRWDAKTARRAGYPFIGIGGEQNWSGWGVRDWRPDLQGAGEFVRLLAKARPVRQESS